MADDLIWPYGNLEVQYREELDGGGTVLAGHFAEFLRDNFRDRLPFGKALEWCSGPGFIGFALLEEELCEAVCLADVSPAAIACVRRTIRRHGLERRARAWVSDGLDGIPEDERFDLVVANPPNFRGLNRAHALYGDLATDLRPHDPAWEAHRNFYSGVRSRLRPGGLVCLSEVEPQLTEVRLADPLDRMASLSRPGGQPPFEVRPRPPIEDFRRMIHKGGLVYRGATRYATVAGDLELYMVVSSAPDAEGAQRLRG